MILRWKSVEGPIWDFAYQATERKRISVENKKDWQQVLWTRHHVYDATLPDCQLIGEAFEEDINAEDGS